MNTLRPDYKKELTEKLRKLIGGKENEVEFSNPALTAIAKCIVMIYCSEWYTIMPEISMSPKGNILKIRW